jgi:hypothetical protein
VDDYDDPPPLRESRLTLMLITLVVVFTVAFLALITGGWIFWLVLVAAGMAGFAAVHYLLWGKLLSDETAGEREEEELRRRATEREEDLP